MAIPESEWRWFGSPGHFIGGFDCHFHLCTLIGDTLISTVGQYLPLPKLTTKYQDIGYNRKYETMVFKVTGKFCNLVNCGCGMPTIVPSGLDMQGYQTGGEATEGHRELCLKWANWSELEPSDV